MCPSVRPSRLTLWLHQIADAELHLTYFGGKEYIYLRPPTTYYSLRYDGLRRVDIVASTRSPEQTVPPILTTIRIPAPDWAQPPIGLYIINGLLLFWREELSECTDSDNNCILCSTYHRYHTQIVLLLHGSMYRV